MNTPYVKSEVKAVIDSTPVLDMHTHIYDTSFGDLLLWGIDELLTYHYLVAEVFRAAPMPYEEFWEWSKEKQADHVWKHLFLDRSPVSEACLGVLTTLEAYGLDITSRDLESYREFFRGTEAGDHMRLVFEKANVDTAVMTNDLFDPVEYELWKSGVQYDPRFRAVLRMDLLLNDWDAASVKLAGWGYDVSAQLDGNSEGEIRRFLEEWIKKMDAVYLASSFSPAFVYPDESVGTRILDKCVLPVARELGKPLALMIGVKRQVHPGLRLAGDGVGKADLSCVENLCREYPKNKFLVTVLSRENQHELCVLARKFSNLMIFGCWWFVNNPSIVEEITRERIEMLGLSMIPQHSDARVLDQLVYKWKHSRAIIGEVLSNRYLKLQESGWRVSQEEIERDVERLLSGNFEWFLDWDPS